MSTVALGSRPRTAPRSLAGLHGLLAVQSLVIVLLTINRLSTLTLGYVAPNEFLRWVDLNNMLVLPLISLVAFYCRGLRRPRGHELPPRPLLPCR